MKKTLHYILVITLISGCSTPKNDEPEDAKIYSMFAGSYANGTDEGIYNLTLNNQTGQLTEAQLSVPAINPSFLSINNDMLYAVSETGEGHILSFFIDRRTLGLFPVDTLLNVGSAPCYITTDNTGFSGFAANYMSGDVLRFEMDNTGKFIDSVIHRKHYGTGPNTQRQEAPHAHSIDFNGDQSKVYAADLGADKILIYDAETMAKIDSILMEPGDGPRHFTLNTDGSRLYVLNELSSSISVFDSQGKLVQNISTLPENYEGENKTADIHFHPGGKVLYGSNRGHDSIVFYEVTDSGELQSPGWLQEKVNWPRNFAVSPDGNWLVVANRYGNNINSYLLKEGIPGELVSSVDVNAPVCIKFFE